MSDMADVRDALVDRIARFLETNYPCSCGAGEPCSEEPEADAIVELIEAAGFGLVREAQAVALEEAAAEADGVIAAGDIAEVAAYCPGESGRSEAVAARDALYEDGPGDFLRARAEDVRDAK